LRVPSKASGRATRIASTVPQEGDLDRLNELQTDLEYIAKGLDQHRLTLGPLDEVHRSWVEVCAVDVVATRANG
jgi:hypothetical protein